ncbi:uncharacterized protein LOC103578405 [Microplitis demolitor]|uniref:uncharacterized protein LOC103578405 n=1 Tax=Microplitis demolitor TaxID=69319 RepID=UPI0004CCE897|nr:uncharacterized protein LOC103578405 [Microplitis demolitor]
MKAVKYLYKYIYKGHDAAAVNIAKSDDANHVIDHDEIQDYIDGRYVGPVEAWWRIFNKELQNKSHTVMRLPVHWPNQQTITINSPETEDSIQNALEKQTMLIDYFALNSRDFEARNLTYAEIPSLYVFKKQKKFNIYSCRRRKSHFNVICRMYSVSPNQIELFHLRLLLVNVKGAPSFEDLKTVNGITYDTYVATCLTLGLIEDDDEWKKVMKEAESRMMPYQLRRLFVRILIYCQPVYPEQLWEEFKTAMSQDFSNQFEINTAYKKAYVQINTMLIAEGSSLSQFPSMKQITETDNDDFNFTSIPITQHKTLGKEYYSKLNEDQKIIVDTIKHSVCTINGDDIPTCFYIDGPVGSGNTFIYTTLYHILKGENKNICTMAYTGIVATLLPHG